MLRFNKNDKIEIIVSKKHHSCQLISGIITQTYSSTDRIDNKLKNCYVVCYRNIYNNKKSLIRFNLDTQNVSHEKGQGYIKSICLVTKNGNIPVFETEAIQLIRQNKTVA